MKQLFVSTTIVAVACVCFALGSAAINSQQPTCPAGMPCTVDSDCNATLGCHQCSQWSNTCQSHSVCLGPCNSDEDCAIDTEGCTKCMAVGRFGGQCLKPSSTCAVNCTGNYDCLRDGNPCSECNTTSGLCQSPTPGGACNSPCFSAADCSLACPSCYDGTCTNLNPGPASCGQNCTHQANCTGTCYVCSGTCVQLPPGDKSDYLARYP